MPPNGNGWPEYRKFVIAELERQSDCDATMLGMLGQIRTDIATLKVKAGIWGLAGGAIPLLIMIVIDAVKG